MANYTSRPDKNQVLIYALLDPRDLKIRYIGKTVQPLKKRLQHHISRARNRKQSYHVLTWMRELLSSGYEPSIHLLEVANKKNWANRERHWIAYGYEKGWKLTNSTSGGDSYEGVKRSMESRKKQGLSVRGEKNHRSKITAQDVYEIRERFANTKTPAIAIGQEYNLSESAIEMIVSGQSWKHVGGTITHSARTRNYTLSEEDVITIRDMAHDGISYTVIAERFSINAKYVHKVINGGTWSHITYRIKTPAPNNIGENNGRAKLTKSDVISIRTRYAGGGVSYGQLAKEYGVSRGLIGMIIRDEIWRDNE